MKKLLTILIISIFSLEAAPESIKRYVLKKYMHAFITFKRDASPLASLAVLPWEKACIQHGVYDELDNIQKYHEQRLAQLSECNKPKNNNEMCDEVLKSTDQYLDIMKKKAYKNPIKLQGERLNNFKKVLEGQLMICETVLAYQAKDPSETYRFIEKLGRKSVAFQILIDQYDLERELDEILSECHGEKMLDATFESTDLDDYLERIKNYAASAEGCLRNYLNKF